MNTAKHILIVDDSRLSRLISSQYVLNHSAAWLIDQASTGEEAIEKAGANRPDLILLDVNMPGMGGMAAAAILRRIHPATPIILLTANVQETTQRRARELGVDFLAKPINEARIHAVLDSVAGPA